MKKILAIAICATTVAANLNACATIRTATKEAEKNDREYMALAQVVELSKEEATFKTADGNEWVWGIEKGESFQLSKVYKVYFDDMGTPGLRDDVILKIEAK